MPKLAARVLTTLLLAGSAAAQIGCSACGSCHDYSSPVANCHCQSCNDCGGGRAGSASAGYYAQNQGDAIDEAVNVAQLPAVEAPLRR